MSSFFDCFNDFLQSGGNLVQNVSQEQEQKIADQELDGVIELMPPTTPTPSESVSNILNKGVIAPLAPHQIYSFRWRFVVK